MDDSVYDVIIVGAGLSGLFAAKLLDENGLNVVVLEARDRVGGRTLTKKHPTYGWVDLGASYVGPGQRAILGLAEELGVGTYTIQDEGDSVFFFKGRSLRYGGATGWPHWNPLEWLDCNNLFRELDALCLEVPLDEPWEAPRAIAWDRMTVQNWLDQMCWTRAAKEWGRQFVHSNVTMEPWEVSFLWLLWYVHSAGGVNSIWELGGAAQEMKFEGGSQQLSEKMAAKLAGRVHLSSPVVKMSQLDSRAVVTTRNAEYTGRQVIVAIPPATQLKVQFDPQMSSLRHQLLQRMPMGSCVKSQTWYRTPFWKEKGYNGVSSTADGETLVGNTIDDSRPGNSYPALTGFIMASEARRASRMSREERRQVSMACAAKFFNSPEALEALHYEDYDWMAEEYTGGCYTSTCPPGVLTEFGRELRRQVGLVHFAGTETATRWSGYMDGAVSAGRRAAGDVLTALGRAAPSPPSGEEEDETEDDEPATWRSMWELSAPSVGRVLCWSPVLVFTLLGVVSWRYTDLRTKLWQLIKYRVQ